MEIIIIIMGCPSGSIGWTPDAAANSTRAVCKNETGTLLNGVNTQPHFPPLPFFLTIFVDRYAASNKR
jgi:hypothetical protein